jgi:hypothetical protein
MHLLWCDYFHIEALMVVYQVMEIMLEIKKVQLLKKT